MDTNPALEAQVTRCERGIEMSLVSFVRIRKRDRKGAVINALGLIQFEFPKEVRNVVIKPNLCYYWDCSTGQTTDPNFVAALIEVIRDQTSSDVGIAVVESDASAMKCKYAFRMLGYEKLAQEHAVDLVNLSEEDADEKTATVNGRSFKFRVPQTIEEASLLINVPKIKYLPLSRFSCALKNMYGCNPYPRKYRYHSSLDEVIVALNKLMKPDLCILDGDTVSGVQPRKLGLVTASQDPVAFDAAGAEIAGVNPRSIQHLTLAHREGLGNRIYLPRGADPGYFKERYPQKRYKDKFMVAGYRAVQVLRLQRRLGLE